MGEMQLSIKTAFLFSVSIYVAIAVSPLLAMFCFLFSGSGFLLDLYMGCMVCVASTSGADGLMMMLGCPL